MVKMLAQLLASVALLFNISSPQVLGETASNTVNYPFTFKASQYTCNYYQSCWNYCRKVFLYGNSEDFMQCRQYFPTAAVINHSNSPSLPIPTSPATTQTKTATKEILPRYVVLIAGQKYQFTLLSLKDGKRYLDTTQKVSWSVVRGGGTITADGIFTAGDKTGLFENTIRAYSSGEEVSATVYIESFPVITPAPIKVEEVSQTAPLDVLNLPNPGTIKSENNETVDICLKQSFSKEEYQQYFADSGEHADLRQLGEKVTQAQECMKLTRLPVLDEETETCLKKELGEDRFNSLYLAEAEPTKEERSKANLCTSKPKLVTYGPDTVDNVSENCLRLKLGNDRFNELKNSRVTPTSEEVSLGRECFNIDSNISKPVVVINTPEQELNCLKNITGEQRFQQISEAKVTPSSSEKDKAKQCLASQNPLQSLFLPRVPQEVFFLPESKKDVSIENATSQVIQKQNVLSLSGKAMPNSLVDIYIFSQPMIVTTWANENGEWNYDLSVHVPAGTHHAYTIIRHPQKGLIRSEVFAFGVAYAKGIAEDIPELMIVKPQRQRRIDLYLLASTSIILFGIGSLMIIYRSYLAGLIEHNPVLDVTYNRSRPLVLSRKGNRTRSKTVRKRK